jgi:helix-turn-helix protein
MPELDIASVPRAKIPALIAALVARLLEPEPEPEPVAATDDKMLTTLEASKLLRRSTKWISRHRKNLPFARKLGERSWVYSEQGLRRWLARQKS